MTLEPIPGEDGSIADYFETDQQPGSSTVSTQTPSVSEQEQPVEEEEQPEVVDGAVLPEGATAALPLDLVEQPANLTPTTAAVSLPREDTTDFDLCDVEIRILLQRVDGDQRGRLVSVLIHNFSNIVVTEDFREVDLTDKARLDSIPRAIYPPMQRFLLKLGEAKQKKLEEEAKRASRTTPPVPNKTAEQLKTPPVSTVVPPAQKPAQDDGQQQRETSGTPQATNDNKKNEKDPKKTGKYQPIALF